MNSRLNFLTDQDKSGAVTANVQELIRQGVEKKKAKLTPPPTIPLQQMTELGNKFKTKAMPQPQAPIAPIPQPVQEQAAPQQAQPPQQDIMKVMSSSGAELGKFLNKPQGMRALSMFMRPDAAMLLNQKADQKEVAQAQAAAAKAKESTKYKPEYIKNVGIFDPNTKQVIPGTTPKDLGTPSLEPAEQFKQEEKLRAQHQNLAKDFVKIRDAQARIVESAKDPSAAGDLALIFNYMKVLDPGSTVREGEFANAQNSGSVDNRTRALYNQVTKGERLSPAMRKDFVNRADRLFKGQKAQYDKSSTQYKKLAKAYNLDPARVVLDLGIAQVPQPQQSGAQITPEQAAEELKRRGKL